VVRGNQQYEQLLASHKESKLTIQNLESGRELLKSDLEGEVINVENLNNSLCVSKALVNTLDIKYAEVAEQLKQNSKTVEDHENNAKALKKSKVEITRLTNKNDEAQNIIEKLRETMRRSFSEKVHDELLQKKLHLENELAEANQKASIAEEEVFMYKVNIFKLSVQNIKLMVALANSSRRQDSLETQLSEAVALGSYELSNDAPFPKFPKLKPKNLTLG
jgi:chromosome segregation ATPase